DRLEAVPMDEVAPEVRLLLDFTAVNNEIGSGRWRFRRDRMEALRRDGLAMTDASLATIEIPPRRFVADTPRTPRLIERCRAQGATVRRFVDRCGAASRQLDLQA